MTQKLSYERYVWFDGLVRAGKFPNAATLAARFGDKALKLTYRSPYKNGTTERTIRPLHLLCYMGNWHLIAYCGLRKDIRDFAVSRIQAVSPCAETLSLPPNLPPIKEYIRRNFGVIAGKRSADVVLRFPVLGFVEVIREILKYGADVEVIEPVKLHDAIKEKICMKIKAF